MESNRRSEKGGRKIADEKPRRPSPVDFLDERVLPALFDRLDAAFPEFGWIRKGRGWVATNRDHTKTLPGAPRPDRVVCSIEWGFYVHGGEAMGWTAYVSGGAEPRGRDFIEAVRKLALLAGIDASALDREPTPEEEWAHRLQTLYERFLNFSKRLLLQEDREDARLARAYLVGRGFPLDSLADLPFGIYPTTEEVVSHLTNAGFGEEEIRASRLVPSTNDQRQAKINQWPGRVVIPWRNHHSRQIETFVARDVTGMAEEGEKYLVLAGTRKEALVAFGLDEAIRCKEGRENLVLVEGYFDAIRMRSLGLRNVAAIAGGGAEMGEHRWRVLGQLGFRNATLVLDNDPKPEPCARHGRAFCRPCSAGGSGTLAALKNALKVKEAPIVYVVEPGLLGLAKDPDDLIREHGLEAFRALLEQRIHGYRYRARSIIEENRPASDWSDAGLRRALDEAIEFDASIHEPARMPDLDRFFWTEITEATGADEDAIQAAREDARRKANEETKRREYQKLARDLAEAAEAGEMAKAKELLSSQVAAIAAEALALGRDPVLCMNDEMDAHQERIQQWRGREFIGLPQRTIPSLDEATLGLRGFMLMAAMPNIGKTALGVQLGVDVVTSNDDACFLFLSLEMSRWEIYTRIKCKLARMDWRTFVFGSERSSGQVSFSEEEMDRMQEADERLRVLGKRIRVLDDRNCLEPTVDEVLRSLDDLKERSGTGRALVLIDYLQVWPIPKGAADEIRAELDADKWRIGCMRRIRDRSEGDAVLVISESRKPVDRKGAWGGDLADVMGSARGSYTPDMVFLFQPLGEKDLRKALGLAEADDLKRAREDLEGKGRALARFEIAKGRDGVLKRTIDLTYWHRQSRFEEGID